MRDPLGQPPILD